MARVRTSTSGATGPITTFHTIREGRDSPLACTAAESRATAILPGHFEVVSLSELLHKLTQGQDISRHLVITSTTATKTTSSGHGGAQKRGLPAASS